jgi:hypothetical protein
VKSIYVITTVLASLTLASPIMALAQNESRVLVNLRIDRVQPGDEDKYISLQADVADALIAENLGPRDVWLEIGKTAGVFHVISPANESPAADEPSLPMITSTERMTLQLYPELTIPPSTGAASEFLTLTYTVVRRDSRDAYFAWLRDHLRPHLQSAGANGVVFSRAVTEGDTDTWIRASNANGANNSSGADEIRSELVESSRTIMLRHVPSASVGVD